MPLVMASCSRVGDLGDGELAVDGGPGTEPTTTSADVADEPGDATSTTATSATDEEPPASVVPGVDAPTERVVPGGDCACADGSEFSFWTRTADPERVVLYLAGGGACFSAVTCQPGVVYQNHVDPNVDPFAGAGILDASQPDNPLADHSVVFVPYCTGDVHLGDATTEYSDELTVEHKGYVNASAALDHLAETFGDATEVVVMGESAGGIAAPLYAGLASDLLPDAEISVVADSAGAYPDVPQIGAIIGASWGVADILPDWPEATGTGLEDWSFPELFVQAGRHDPDLRLARHDYAYDAVQGGFVSFVAAGSGDVLTLIEQNEAQIEAAGVEVASYLAPGIAHTVLRDGRLYTEEVAGEPLIDWLTSFLAGDPVPDIHCTDCQSG
ncbi:MAG: pectin acetylesterase-family hydrolase [Actinomycetota bacterium]|nr:pectin acetylesterase-family hydrolase [Actinomycetota bacterium]